MSALEKLNLCQGLMRGLLPEKPRVLRVGIPFRSIPVWGAGVGFYRMFVRSFALAAESHGLEFGLLVEKTFVYTDQVKMKDFRAFHDRLTMINPHVRERFEEKEEVLHALFEKLGRQTEDGWLFDQPMRAHLMRRS